MGNLARYSVEPGTRLVVLRRTRPSDRLTGLTRGGAQEREPHRLSYADLVRRKVDIVDPPLIHTVRGVGYVLRTPTP